MFMARDKTVSLMTSAQKRLLEQIRAKEKQILAHEREADKLQRGEHFDYANEEKTEADMAARDLRDLLHRARDMDMDTADFPVIQNLFKKYLPNEGRGAGDGRH